MFSKYGFMPFFVMIMLGTFLSASALWAQLPSEVEETSFNLQLNSLPGSKTSIGTGLEVPLKIGSKVDGFFASLFQSNGATVRGRYYAELGFNIKNFRVIPYLNGTGRGPGWKEVALVNDIGLSFEVKGVGGEYFDVRGGFFGQSGGAFGKSNLFDLGAANGYDENRMEEFSDANGITLAQLNQAPAGINPQPKNSFNGLVQVDFNLPNGIGGTAKLMPEIVGSDGLEATDQATVSLSTLYGLGERVNLRLGMAAGMQRYRESGNTETEVAGFFGIIVKL